MDNTSRVVKRERKNWFYTYNMILDQDISIHSKMLYITLCRYADSEGQSFPSRETLAKKCSVTTKTIDRAMKELIAIGVVSKESRQRKNGSQSSNLYIVFDSTAATRGVPVIVLDPTTAATRGVPVIVLDSTAAATQGEPVIDLDSIAATRGVPVIALDSIAAATRGEPVKEPFDEVRLTAPPGGTVSPPGGGNHSRPPGGTVSPPRKYHQSLGTINFFLRTTNFFLRTIKLKY